MNGEVTSVAQMLESLVTRHTEEKVSLGAIRNSLHEQGFCFMMIVLAFPAALPLPYPPGFTTLVGIPLILFAVQMLLGKDAPWLPEWLGKRTIRRPLLVSIVKKSIPLLHKIERYTKHRLPFNTTLWGEKLVGSVCLLCAILISIPIPFGHAVPAMAVLIMSLGFLASDGITIIVGMLTAILGVAIDIALVFVGKEAVHDILFFISNLH